MDKHEFFLETYSFICKKKMYACDGWLPILLICDADGSID